MRYFDLVDYRMKKVYFFVYRKEITVDDMMVYKKAYTHYIYSNCSVF